MYEKEVHIVQQCFNHDSPSSLRSFTYWVEGATKTQLQFNQYMNQGYITQSTVHKNITLTYEISRKSLRLQTATKSIAHCKFPKCLPQCVNAVYLCRQGECYSTVKGVRGCSRWWHDRGARSLSGRKRSGSLQLDKRPFQSSAHW